MVVAKKKSKGAAIAAGKLSAAEWLATHKGKAMTLEENFSEETPHFPIGNFIFDQYLTGIGGLPKGRIVEFIGPESAGKSTLALQAIVSIQKQGGMAYFIDAEHALNPRYFTRLGGDRKKMVISQPDSGEECFDLAVDAIRAGWPSVIVFDSVANMVPMKEVEDDMDGKGMGLHARMMAKGLRKLTAVASNANVLIIFINQIRNKIGISFGSSETTTGGRALPFYASMRFDIRSVGKILEGGVAVGAMTRIRNTKNKFATPFKEAVVNMIYGEGFSNGATLFDIARLNNLGVSKSKNTWTVGDVQFNGRAKALKAFLADDFLQMDVAEGASKLLKKGKLEIPVVERGEK